MLQLSENDIPADSTLDAPQGVEGQSGEAIPSITPDPTPAPQVFEYQASGKTISEDLDTILKRASQGYNYAQHVAEHKASVDAFNQERDQYQQKYGTWKQYDEYANQNPSWADHVKTQWELRDSFGQPQSDLSNQTNPSESIHPEIRQFMDQYKFEKQTQQQQAEDAALNEQIKNVQEQFPEFDLSYSNPETGMTVEMQVIEHAKAHGINSFKAAFKDLMFDQIVNKRITSAKEAAAKELAERTKKGFISTSDTSLTGLGLPKIQNRQNGSLQDRLFRGAAELGITL